MHYQDLDPAVIEMTKAYPAYAPEPLLQCLVAEIGRQGRTVEKMPEPELEPKPEPPVENVTSLILCPADHVDDKASKPRPKPVFHECKDNKRHETDSARILREVASAHRFPNGVTRVMVADIKSERRPRWLVRIRHEAMYRLAMETTLSFPQIGRILRRDHTSILHGYKKHAELHDLPLRPKEKVTTARGKRILGPREEKHRRGEV